MKNLRSWFASTAGKRFFNIFYSLGAAIVVIGAMFKIIHFPGANIVFITGMVVEAIVFALSAFDTSSYDSTPVTVARNVAMNDHIEETPEVVNQGTTKVSTSTSGVVATNNNKPTTSGASVGGNSGTVILGGGQSGGSNTGAVVAGGNEGVAGTTPNSGSPVIVVSGGGGNGGNSGINVGSSANAGGSVSSNTNNTTPIASNLNTLSPNIVGDGGDLNISTQEYSKSVSSAAQNLEDFSKNMQSLNESSQTLLDAYKHIAEAQNMSETMNTVKYINDSLSRIKNLYDGAIGDSYMFKEEMSKMTRHIEALNSVYARLLQAMTANNNNPNNNPPIY